MAVRRIGANRAYPPYRIGTTSVAASTWLNHVTVLATAGTPHTVDPSNPAGSGTVQSGAAFTPTAGNLLICIVGSAVTSTTPSGWTLRSSSVNTDGLYFFTKTAAGGDTFGPTTHNSGAFTVTFDFYEFPAGASYQTSSGALESTGNFAPTLSSLSTPAFIMVIYCGPANTGSVEWRTTLNASGGFTLMDYNAVGSHHYSVAYLPNWQLASVVVAAYLEQHEHIIAALAFS